MEELRAPYTFYPIASWITELACTSQPRASEA